MKSAKDSLSHRSSHHFMVTRSPNHMCHFVADGVGSAFEVVLSCAGDEDVIFGEGDQAGVLHCADVVFRYECLLVLGVRVG